MPTEAGKGEHRTYRIVTDNTDPGPLTPNQHYLGVDAVAWFINKQSSWFADRIASGTLDIKVAAGVERYQAALGTFELRGGSRTAPVFERPVLPDRNYRGGPITFGASLSAIKRDTAVAGLLKSAAAASLGVAAGMVQTATASGPVRLLGAAGDELIAGVRRVLSDTGEKREPLFDFSGFEASLSPERIIGREMFLLLHRGAEIDQRVLTIRAAGDLLLPFVNELPLEDGVWLLLRLRRSSEYSGQRDWYEAARALRGRVQNIVNDFNDGIITRESALAQLLPSATANATAFDEYTRLRAIVQNDGVLSEREASLHVAQLRLTLTSAREAINSNQPALMARTLQETKAALLAGASLTDEAKLIYREEMAALEQFRRAAVVTRQSAELVSEEPRERLLAYAASASIGESGEAGQFVDMPRAIGESFRS